MVERGVDIKVRSSEGVLCILRAAARDGHQLPHQLRRPCGVEGTAARERLEATMVSPS